MGWNQASDRFKDALRGDHTRVSRATLMSNGVDVMTLPVSDGSVSVDSTAQIRRSAQFEIKGRDDLIPTTSADSLFPRVNEVRIETGIQFAPGDPRYYIPPDEEYVPLGIFRIDEPKISGDSISIQAYDRSDKVAGNKLTSIYVVPAGQLYTDAIKALILSRDPRAKFNFVSLPYKTPQIILDIEADPWDEAIKMASAISCDLYSDVTGYYALMPEPDPSTSPVVWEYLDGQGNLLIEGDRTISGSYGYNHVAVRGFTSTGEEGPVFAEAWDDDPNSPTFAGDPPGSSDYGLVTYFVATPFLSTQAQGLAYAKAQLLRVLGAGETMSCSAIPNPLHEAGDVVHIRYSRLRVDGKFVMQSFEVPLLQGQMSFDTKRRQIQ